MDAPFWWWYGSGALVTTFLLLVFWAVPEEKYGNGLEGLFFMLSFLAGSIWFLVVPAVAMVFLAIKSHDRLEELQWIPK